MGFSVLTSRHACRLRLTLALAIPDEYLGGVRTTNKVQSIVFVGFECDGSCLCLPLHQYAVRAHRESGFRLLALLARLAAATATPLVAAQLRPIRYVLGADQLDILLLIGAHAQQHLRRESTGPVHVRCTRNAAPLPSSNRTIQIFPNEGFHKTGTVLFLRLARCGLSIV